MKQVKFIPFTDEQLKQHRLWVESHGSAGTRLVINTTLYQKNFDGIDMSHVEFRGRMSQCSFRETNLEGAIIARPPHFSSIVASGCDFTGANLSMAHMEHAFLSWSNFTSADFSGAFLTSANFNGCTMDEYPKGIPTQEEYMNANFIPMIKDGEHLGWIGYVITDKEYDCTISKTEMPCVGDRRVTFPIEPPGITVFTLDRCYKYNLGYRYAYKVWRCFIPKTATLCVPYGADRFVYVSRIEPLDIVSDPFLINADTDIERIVRDIREIATGDERW